MADSMYFIEEQSSIKCVACKTVVKDKATYLCYYEENEEGNRKTRRMCLTCGTLQMKREIRQTQKLLKKLKRASALAEEATAVPA